MRSLSDAELGYLIRLISDLESGHPRQWYWLEILQTLPKPEKTSPVFLMGILLKAIGIELCSPILCKIKGGMIYQAKALSLTAFAEQKLNDALLFFGCLLAMLLGFQRLSATLQFATWCLGLGGAAWQIWRVFRQNTTPAAISDESDELPGSESSLGLPSILLAAGVPTDVSLALVKGLKHDPDSFVEPLLQNAPLLAPDTEPQLKHKYLIATLPWLLLSLINSYLIGMSSGIWGTLATMVLMGSMAMFMHRLARIVLLTSWLSCLALASIAHYL